jgi:thioredoxin domain-containing protein 5
VIIAPAPSSALQWCGHCKRLAPVWEDLAESFKGSAEVNIATVDCTVEKDLCSKLEIKGYPTLKVFHGGEAKDSYRGARDLSALKTYIQEQAKTFLGETTE